MAHNADMFSSYTGLPALAAVLSVTALAGPLLDDFLDAADRGRCIEGVTYRMISEHGAANASAIVTAALEAYRKRERQQRALGCTGDIAAQAIAAGAEPEQVLEATAAGL